MYIICVLIEKVNGCLKEDSNLFLNNLWKTSRDKVRFVRYIQETISVDHARTKGILCI